MELTECILGCDTNGMLKLLSTATPQHLIQALDAVSPPFIIYSLLQVVQLKESVLFDKVWSTQKYDPGRLLDELDNDLILRVTPHYVLASFTPVEWMKIGYAGCKYSQKSLDKIKLFSPSTFEYLFT